MKQYLIANDFDTCYSWKKNKGRGYCACVRMPADVTTVVDLPKEIWLQAAFDCKDCLGKGITPIPFEELQ